MNFSTNDCMYLRKSRMDIEAETGGETETLARHETQLMELAERNSCCIRSIYREVVSGETIAARPVIRRLLEEVEAGLWRFVLVMDIDRLARGNTMDQGRIMDAFRYSGTRIITPMKIYDPQNEYDEEYMEFGLFMSRREDKMINRRIQRGRLQSAREGKYIGNIPPYGYDRKKLPKEKGWTLVPNEQQAPVVAEIFSLFCREEPPVFTPASIARRLNSLAIPSVSGRPWSASSVRTILKNPVYAGYIKFGSRPQIKRMKQQELVICRPYIDNCPLFPGRHEAIIPAGQFQKARQRFSSGFLLPESDISHDHDS